MSPRHDEPQTALFAFERELADDEAKLTRYVEEKRATRARILGDFLAWADLDDDQRWLLLTSDSYWSFRAALEARCKHPKPPKDDGPPPPQYP
jgi:hypothetical protein